MSNNKQSSVEWYFEQIRKEKYEEDIDWYGLLEQAKAMQKKETINSYCDGRLSVINKNVISAEQYYNETFGGNK